MKTINFFILVLILNCFSIIHLSAQIFTQAYSLSGGYRGNVAWGDYDNDNDLDLLVTGGSIAKLYKNTGSSFVEQTGANFTFKGVYDGSAAWGDYNNDGYLDILISTTVDLKGMVIYTNNQGTGFTELTGISLGYADYSFAIWGDYNNDGFLDILVSGRFGLAETRLYKNNGNGTFSRQTDISLKGGYNGCQAFGDYDNDGDLDILLSGYDGSTSFTKIYKNNGNNTFTDMTSITLTGVSGSWLAWGDYDNDGDLDILLSGGTSKIYRNDGNDTFTEQTGISLQTYGNSCLAWGDYDSDGDLDIIIGGVGASAKIYTNNGNNTFTELTGETFPGLDNGCIDWGDYDNDGDLDIAMENYDGCYVYTNTGTAKNTIPTVPTNLSFVINGADVTFKWNKATDNKTPAKGLTYNIYIGNSPGAVSIKSPMANVSSGYRKVVQMGNTGQDTFFIFKNIPGGKHYWSVQAVDNSFAGSAFAAEQTLEIPINFVEQTTSNLTGLRYSIATWGDYNNDNKLDLLVTGYNDTTQGSKIFKNNGDNTFTEQFGIISSGIEPRGTERSSQAFGDYDNDGDLDVILSGKTASGNVTKIYRNNGNNTFSEQTGIILTGVVNGSVGWGDYDNDGDLDILLTGQSSTGVITKIYRNNHDNTFTELSGLTITGISKGDSKWFDYNNDGYLDFIIAGENAGTTPITKIYRNNGDNTVTELTNLNGVSWCSIECGDYNNDGFTDILLAGYIQNSPYYYTGIYKNNGNETFTEQTGIALPGITIGTANWGDYNNDGYLDILLSGKNSSTTRTTKLYRNNKNNTFSEVTGLTLPQIESGVAIWGDYNNDNNLDILFTGVNITKLYRNNYNRSNTIPQVPTGLTAQLSGNDLILKWNAVRNDSTPPKGLTYNLRVGTSSGGCQTIAPHSSSNGLRQIVNTGNGQQDTTFILKNLKKGTYYWSIQAIDNCFAGSAFAGEQSYVFNKDIQAHHITFDSIQSTTINLTFSRGNGDSCLVFVKETSLADTARPVNNITYTAGNSFGTGSQIGTTGWYCVYKGRKDRLTVTNLKVYTKYIFNVIEYSGAPGLETYVVTAGVNNPLFKKTNLFTELKTLSLQHADMSDAACGDYDNDGKLDIILTGHDGSNSISKIYKNTGSNNFIEQTGITLTGIHNGSSDWGDYDNDGDLDILISGQNGTNIITNHAKVYRNNGDNTFTEQTGIVLPGVKESDAAWGDYDNDGDLDILLTGIGDGAVKMSRIYKNNGDNTFTLQAAISLTGISYSSIAWGDYDNDGDLDILQTGSSTSGSVSKIYRNNGDNTFIEQTAMDLPNIFNGSVSWGDYDCDGYLDILISGSYISRVYKNNGNNTFTNSTTIVLQGLFECAGAWGDYDNDGDLDIILSGRTASTSTTKVYRNNGDQTFTEDDAIILPPTALGSLNWFDYDNDGDLDLLIGSCAGNTKLFRNEISVSNSRPGTPVNLSIVIHDSVYFKWDKCVDDKTGSNGLSYNLYVYEDGQTPFIRPPHAFKQSDIKNGQRLIAQIGNIQWSTSGYKLKLAAGKTYKWTVQAVDASLLGSPFASEASFSIPLPPATPTLSTPADLAVDQQISLAFTWNSASGATSYHIQIATSSAFTSPLVNLEGITATVYNASGLNYSTKYYWRVRAAASGVFSNWSPTREFTTMVIPAPDAPVLISPANNAVDQPFTLNLTWNAAARASSYTLQTSTASDFSVLILNLSGLTTTSQNISSLGYNTKYYWRVRAVNDGGNSSWSSANFTTLPEIPEIPSGPNPANNAMDQPVSLTLSWNVSARATSYIIEVSLSSDLSSPFINESVTTNSKSLSGLSNSTKYYWHVKSVNSGGLSAFSSTWNFTTIIAAPEAPVLSSPSTGAVNQALGVNLTWNSAARAASYTIEVSLNSGFSTTFLSESNITGTSKSLTGLSNSTKYYWRVKSVNAGGQSVWSSVWDFTTMPAVPDAPVLSSPATNTSNWLSPYTFTWNAAARAETYQIQISVTNDFSSGVTGQSLITTTTYQASSLPGNTKYYWRVRASNVGGTGSWSSVWEFTTAPDPPGSCVLYIPSSGAINQQTTLTLSWSSAAGAGWYILQVSTVEDFSTTVVNETNVTQISKQVTGLSYNTKYYWRVRAANAGGSSNWSTISNFTTADAPPDAPTLNQPAAGALVNYYPVVISWNASGRAVNYYFEVSTTSNFSNIVANSGSITGLNYTLNNLIANTKYYWHVNAWNYGGTSPWSETRDFTTLPEKPEAPVPSSPLSGATNQPLSLTLQWSASTGATTYALQVSVNSDFSSPIVNNSSLTTTSYALSSLLNNTKYYWHVSATNAGGTSNWSSTMEFTTVIAAPDIPVAVSPADNATNQPVSLTISWNAALRASTYSIEVSTNSTFSSVLINQTNITNTNSVISGLLYGTKYYWHVKAVNAGGSCNWSTTMNFTTQFGTSVQNKTTVPLSVYPNPATNELFISGTDTFPLVMSVININGSVILKKMIFEPKIDISGLPNGLYYLKLETKKGVGIMKFSKQ